MYEKNHEILFADTKLVVKYNNLAKDHTRSYIKTRDDMANEEVPRTYGNKGNKRVRGNIPNECEQKKKLHKLVKQLLSLQLKSKGT